MREGSFSLSLYTHSYRNHHQEIGVTLRRSGAAGESYERDDEYATMRAAARPPLGNVAVPSARDH